MENPAFLFSRNLSLAIEAQLRLEDELAHRVPATKRARYKVFLDYTVGGDGFVYKLSLTSRLTNEIVYYKEGSTREDVISDEVLVNLLILYNS